MKRLPYCLAATLVAASCWAPHAAAQVGDAKGTPKGGIEVIPEWTYGLSEPDLFTGEIIEAATVSGIIFDTPHFSANRLASLSVICLNESLAQALAGMEQGLGPIGFLDAPGVYFGLGYSNTRAYFKLDDLDSIRREVGKTSNMLFFDKDLTTELYELGAGVEVLMIRVDSEGRRYDFEFSLIGFREATEQLSCVEGPRNSG